MLLGTLQLFAGAQTYYVGERGDVDGDGSIGPRDAAIVARYLARWKGYADGNGNVVVPEVIGAFSVGYYKVDVTPDLNFYKRLPLAGYGNTDTRLATGVPAGDGLYATCIALRDAEGNTVLLFSLDRIGISSTLDQNIRDSIRSATGVPVDNISITTTHTHTGPDNSSSAMCGGFISRYNLEMIQKMALAARRAIVNLAPATMWAGDTCVTDINFVRRYLVWYSDSTSYQTQQTHYLVGDDHRIGYEGPNTIDAGVVYYAHETPGDNEVQYILFKREGMQDVLLYNWQCHPDQIGNGNYDLTVDGQYAGYVTKNPAANKVISADFINGARTVLEREGYLTAYFQGAAGNMNQSDHVNGIQNLQIGSDKYAKYRLPGWDSRYYSNAYYSTSSNKAYWKSQMVGAIVADSILTDVVKPYQEGETRNETWTDNWTGPRELPTGEVRAIKSLYYSTYQSNDRDLKVTMAHLAGVADGSVTVEDTYTVTYSKQTFDDGEMRAEIQTIRDLAAEYAELTEIAEQKAFAWNVLNTYRKKINDAFAQGMKDNGGSGGSNNLDYAVARLWGWLATGLYINNYYANSINSRNSRTDLTVLDTDPTKYTYPIPLRCFSIGQSVAFCMGSYEMFDTIAQQIKDGKYIRYREDGIADTVRTKATHTGSYNNGTTIIGYPVLYYEAAQYDYTDAKSPFTLTFVAGYSNGSNGYIPTKYARNHTESQNNQNGYETYVTHYVPGTAEEHGEEFLIMLDILYNGGDTSPRTVGHLKES